eukprot:UN18811
MCCFSCAVPHVLTPCPKNELAILLCYMKIIVKRTLLRLVTDEFLGMSPFVMENCEKLQEFFLKIVNVSLI